jgi:hypothetical protein
LRLHLRHLPRARSPIHWQLIYFINAPGGFAAFIMMGNLSNLFSIVTLSTARRKWNVILSNWGFASCLSLPGELMNFSPSTFSCPGSWKPTVAG